MTTATAPKEMEKWSEIVPRFASEIYAKYPGIDDSWTTTLVDEIKVLGFAKEFVSYRALTAAFRNACADGRITLPVQPKVNIGEATQKLQAAFPPVVKKVRKDSSTDYVNRQSGRMTHQERSETNAAVNKDVATVKNLSRLAELRTQYRSLKTQAETAMGSNPRNHAETASVRKAALAKLNSDPRFAEVRES